RRASAFAIASLSVVAFLSVNAFLSVIAFLSVVAFLSVIAFLSVVAFLSVIPEGNPLLPGAPPSTRSGRVGYRALRRATVFRSPVHGDSVPAQHSHAKDHPIRSRHLARSHGHRHGLQIRVRRRPRHGFWPSHHAPFPHHLQLLGAQRRQRRRAPHRRTHFRKSHARRHTLPHPLQPRRIPRNHPLHRCARSNPQSTPRHRHPRLRRPLASLAPHPPRLLIAQPHDNPHCALCVKFFCSSLPLLSTLYCLLSQPQLFRPRLHRRKAIPHVLVQTQPQQLRSMRNILALHRPRERLILHLLLHARDLHLGNLLCRLHQRTRRQETRQLIARIQRAVEMRLRLHARIIRVRQNRMQNLLRPSLLAQVIHSHKRMLVRCRMPLVVEVVQQTRAPVPLRKRIRLRIPQTHRRCFPRTIALRTRRHRQAVLHQRLILRPLAQQLLRLRRAKPVFHRTSPRTCSTVYCLPSTVSTLYPLPSTLYPLLPLTTNHCLSYLPPWFKLRFSPVFLPESSAIPLDSSGTGCHSRHIAHLFIRRDALRCPLWQPPATLQYGNWNGSYRRPHAPATGRRRY